MAKELKLPELGENIESGQVISILVSEGDTIEKDQPVLEIETDKASIEVPSSAAGTVQEIKVAEGDEVQVGDVILLLAEEQAAEEETAGDEEEAETPEEEAEAAATEEEPREETEEAGQAEEEEEEEPEEAEAEEEETAEEEEPEEEEAPEGEEAESAEEEEEGSRTVPFRPRGKEEEGEPAPASPAVRRLARELGVDIHAVRGSGDKGRISREDVKAHVKGAMRSGGPAAAAAPAAVPQPSELPDFEKWGEVERKPLGKVRTTIAKNLASAWVTIPHVTHHDEADVTDLEELRKSYAERAEKKGGKLTVTAILLKVVAQALEVFPKLNASIDLEAGEVVYKRYVHIGVAVDTERGLLVPVVRDVDEKSIMDLAVELGEIAQKARDKKLSIEEMRGASFTLTNLGGIGGTAFTPIVNHPEVGILGVSRTRTEPRWIHDRFVPREILPLSFSYDHRLVDGADAARFVRWICQALEKPLVTVLEE